MRWWEQDVCDMEGMRTAAREAEQTEGSEERYWTENATDDQLSGGDTVVTITLGTDHNAPLVYAPELELQHPIISTIGAHGGQLEIEREIPNYLEFFGYQIPRGKT